MRRFLKLFLLVALLLPLLASCGDKNKTKYLAVKLNKTDKWSIIDLSNGKVVVKEEFSYKPSPIVNDRFFVENANGEFELHEVKNYGKPIKTYKLATNFYDNRAIVSEDGKTLQVIDDEGKVIKKLPDDIKGAMTFHNGYAVVMNDKDKQGYIDTDGEFLVKPTYDQAKPFSKDHFAIVKKKKGDDFDDNYKVSVINDKGEELFSFDMGEKEKYNHIASDYFVNGSMAVAKGEDVVYLDKNGEQIFKAGDAIPGAYGIYKGATIFAKDEQWGIMDDKGEVLVKAKYDDIVPIENGKFMAKDDKVIIIDKEGEKVNNDSYEELVKITEDRLLAKYKSDQGYTLIDSDGKEICDESFIDYSDPEEIKTINLDEYVSHKSDDDTEEAVGDGEYSSYDDVTYDRPYNENSEGPYEDDENIYGDEEQAVQPKDDYDYEDLNEL